MLSELAPELIALGALAIATVTGGSVGAAWWLKRRRKQRDARR